MPRDPTGWTPTQKPASRAAARGCTSTLALWTVSPALASPAVGLLARPPCPRLLGSGHGLRCVEQKGQNWPNRASGGLKTSSLVLESIAGQIKEK